MRHMFARRLFASAALALALSLPGGQALLAADTKPAKAAVEKPFDPDKVDTFSGAFLAARTADTDYDFANAIKLYQRALSLDPTNLEVKERLMLAMFLGGRFDEGVVLAEELKTDPSMERLTTVARGIDAIRKGRFEDAVKILKYEGPNDLDRMVNTLLTAWSKTGEGKTKDALALIDQMKGPEWFAVFRNYSAGMMAMVGGDKNEARKRLNEAVADREAGAAASDTYMRAVLALAVFEASEGNRQKALDAISAGEAFAPSYTPLETIRKAIEAGEKLPLPITNAVEGTASVMFAVGGALNQSLNNSPDRQSGQDFVAFYLETAHALDPKAADTLVLLGGLAENLEQPERAIGYYKQVPEASPLRRISEMQLGLNLAQIGKTDDAKAHLKALMDSNPGDMRAYVAYGSVLSDTKDYAEMAKVYDRAVATIGPVPRKTDWNIFFQRGIAYERLKQWPQAEPNFKKALELNPDQPQVLNYLGYSWVDMNMNLDEGLNMIRRAVDLRPDDGYIVDSLGWAYYRLGRFEDAVSELERAVELKAGDPTINDHLGDAYWRVGRTLEAVYQWKRALVMKPEAMDVIKIEGKIKDGLPALDPAKAGTVEKTETKETVDPAVKKEDNQPPSDPSMADPTIHRVNAGDSLWKIAAETLGNGYRFVDIIAVNPQVRRHPDRIKPGDLLKIPARVAP